MDKEKELELKVKMFCEVIRSSICENTYDRAGNIAESVNEAFYILKQRTDNC